MYALIRRYTDSVTSHRAAHHHHKGTLIRRRERRSCRANERKTRRKKRSRLSREEREGETAIARLQPLVPIPSSPSLSFPLVVIYVKIFHGTAALSACNAPKTFARAAGPLPLSRSVLSVFLSVSPRPAFPTRRKVPRAEGGGRINFGR